MKIQIVPLCCFLCVLFKSAAQKDFMEINGGNGGNYYTYQNYLSDKKIAAKIYSALLASNYDTIVANLPKYKSRLGHSYYLFMAGLLQLETDPYAYNYLDTAFQKGADIDCALPFLKGMEKKMVIAHYRENSMKGVDIRLVATVDSLLAQSQLYRNEIRNIVNLDLLAPRTYFNDIVLAKNSESFSKEQKVLVDSLLKRQYSIDQNSLKFMMRLGGIGRYPVTDKIGETTCAKPDRNPNQLLAYAINQYTAANVGQSFYRAAMLTCKMHEEDWGKTETALKAYYDRPVEGYRDFYFLVSKDQQLDTLESEFALRQMAEVIVKNYPNKVLLESSNSRLVEQVKMYLLRYAAEVDVAAVNKQFRRNDEAPAQVPKPNQLEFVPNSSLAPELVRYRFLSNEK